jgi:glycine cleavage system H protein
MARPEDLKYSPTHEWLRLEGDVGVVGITDHAVAELGDLAFIDLPEKGARAEKGASFGEIESTKTVSELFAPASGEIIDVNTELVENLQRITDSPFEEGWMIKIRLENPAEVRSLLSAADYEAQIAAEEH